MNKKKEKATFFLFPFLLSHLVPMIMHVPVTIMFFFFYQKLDCKVTERPFYPLIPPTVIHSFIISLKSLDLKIKGMQKNGLSPKDNFFCIAVLAIPKNYLLYYEITFSSWLSVYDNLCSFQSLSMTSYFFLTFIVCVKPNAHSMVSEQNNGL